MSFLSLTVPVSPISDSLDGTGIRIAHVCMRIGVRRGWDLHPQNPEQRFAIYKIAGLADAQPLRLTRKVLS